MKKINCGGFYINEDNFEITDDGELKLKSGSGGGGNIVRCPLTVTTEGNQLVYTAGMTAAELRAADQVVFVIEDEYGSNTCNVLTYYSGESPFGASINYMIAVTPPDLNASPTLLLLRAMDLDARPTGRLNSNVVG